MGGKKRTVLVEGKPIEAQFVAKEWDSRTETPKIIRDSLVLGKFVVYGIRLDVLNENSFGSLESYLVKSYENTNGIRPVFNKKS